jgi:predicted enzyme related to lactoylglutathione lyase
MLNAPNIRIKKMSPQLLVTNLGHSIEYYTKKLGFEVEFLFEDFYAGLIKDGFSIHLKSGTPSIEERENRKSHEALDILFSVTELEDLHNEMLNKSVEIIQPLREMPYGREFYIADPDGYLIGFLQEA